MSDDISARLTAAVRAADSRFESVGGSSRHYVRDCLLPALEIGRLSVVDVLVPIHHRAAERDVNSLSVKLDAAEIGLNVERTIAAHLLDACRKMDAAGRATWGDDLALVPAQWRSEMAAIRKAIALATPAAPALSASDLAVCR